MTNPDTRRSAGRIDLVVASDSAATEWHALEIQAVYFSGPGMVTDFQILSGDGGSLPPAPSEVRRPDWRSSSAKRLMPQVETKVPTLRQWGKKVAVAVDSTFFNELGGASSNASQDLNEGDVIWLVPRMGEGGVLERHHWEVLTMEASSEKLLSADRIRRHGFEDTLRAKLRPLL